MDVLKNCSYKNHGDIKAISYCIECNVFMCNKCLNYHSEFLDNHHNYNLDQNIVEIFTGICKESKHKNELEYYCKDHNQLCCAACLSKIKGKGNGQHSDCNVFFIEEIENEKKNKLCENIKYLEEFSNKIENSINELKKISEKINENKEEIKKKILKIFTKLRTIINEREDEILSELDKKFNELYFKEDIIRESQKLPLKMKTSLEKGKLLIKEWDNNSKLNFKINDCITIENNIKIINEINSNIDKCNIKGMNIKFFPEEDEIELLEKLKTFGTIVNNEQKEQYKFKFKPGINYSLSNNNLIAKKTGGGGGWNCSIFGDKEIPKYQISKWKIRLNNFDTNWNTWNILIGIGPNNLNIKSNFHRKCWSFICGNSNLCLEKNGETEYNNYKGALKKGDIIEVIVDRNIGNLSFAINEVNYGIAFSNIPKEDQLYPIVNIYEEKQEVELLL